MLKGKKVRVFYDNIGGVAPREGIVTDEDSEFITIDSNVLIPKLKVVRIEILENRDIK